MRTLATERSVLLMLLILVLNSISLLWLYQAVQDIPENIVVDVIIRDDIQHHSTPVLHSTDDPHDNWYLKGT